MPRKGKAVPQGKKQNADSEPGRRVNIYLYPEDEAIVDRLLPFYHQKGLTGLIRALLKEENARRFPQSIQPRTMQAEPRMMQAEGGKA